MRTCQVLPRIPDEEGEAGQILRVKLVNFMSHSNFELYFKRYVNLIHGENGSGKSAILQAVQLCLGARASQTGRGKSKKLKDFIKHGSNQATVHLSIWNTGSAAHKYELFGNVITVERKIGQANNSFYALYAANGTKVSTSRSDVEDMMTTLNISANNPIVVLTQDGAREFLKDGQLDRSMYNLYMQATLFRETMESMKTADASIKFQQQKCAKMEKEIKGKAKELDDLEGRIKILSDAQDISQRLRYLRQCYPYVQIQEWRKVVEEMKKTLEEDIIPENENLHLKLAERRKDLLEAGEQQKEANAKMRDLKRKIDETKMSIGQLNQEKSGLQRIKNANTRRLRQLQENLKESEEEKQSFEKEIQSTREANQQDIQTATRNHEDNLRSKGERLKSLEVSIFRGNQDKTEFEAARDAIHEEFDKQEVELKEMDSRVKEMKSRSRQQQQGMKDPYANFGGDSMRAFCNFIEQHKHRFHAKPLGPIGMFLSLEDDFWGVAVEFVLRHKLMSFVVTDFHDKRLLLAAAERFGRHRLRSSLDVMIYNFSNPAYMVRSPKTITTMLQVVRFNQDHENVHVIHNVLIDTCHIELTGLMDNENEAMRVVASSTPIYQVYLPDGRRVFRKKKSVNSVHDGGEHSPSLAKDMTSVLQRWQREISNAEAELETGKTAYYNIRTRLKTEERNLHKAIEGIRKSQQEYYQVETELEQLREAGPRLVEDRHGNIHYMEESIVKLDEEAARMRIEVKQVAGELEDASGKLLQMADRVSIAAGSREEVITLAKAARQEIDELNQRWNTVKNDVNTYQLDLTAVETRRGKDEGYIEKYMEKIAEAQSDAENNCSEEEFRRAMQWLFEDMVKEFTDQSQQEIRDLLANPDWLEKRAQMLQRTLEKSQRRAHGNLEDLQEKKAILDADVDESKAVFMDLKTQHDMQKKMYRSRAVMFNKLREGKDQEVDITFATTMRRRGHWGNVSIDHESDHLSLKVRMQGQEKSVVDMRSLSGGEKSFTTVAFILSLASIIVSPFYCLDEFDVFMDAINRKKVIEALLHEAYHNRKSSQFIFFTPLPTGELEEAKMAVNAKLESHNECFPNDFVTVFRLDPPRE